MNPSQSELPFFEDLNDALRALVKALGGTKVVAAKLWPEKPITESQPLLSDCLNPLRREKLSPQQLVLMLRWGREAGYHATLAYICQETGYDTPKALSLKEEAATLMDRAAELARESRAVATQLERIHQSGILRTIGKTAT